MNKANFTIGLTALCATLLAISLVNQSKQNKQIESRLAQSQQLAREQQSEMKGNFSDMRRQLDDLVNSGALFPDKSKPAEAVALAKAAEQAGETNLAKIYYLSAVNHAPSEFSHLKNGRRRTR